MRLYENVAILVSTKRTFEIDSGYRLVYNTMYRLNSSHTCDQWDCHVLHSWLLLINRFAF